LDYFVFAGLLTLGGLGVGLLLGQCGIVNLAQAAFYGIGAYSTAYCTTVLQWPAFSGMAIGCAISTIVTLTVGIPILRLTGFFLALATLSISLIANALFFEWDDVTGGTLGIGGIPSLSFFGIALDTPARFFYFIWLVVAGALLLASNLVSSRVGLAMRAMRDAPPAAEGLGIDIPRLQLAMFVICGILGSVAGSLFAHYVTFISVQSFSVERSILFLLVPIIAGSTTVVGLVVGALFVVFIPELLSPLGDLHHTLFGVALVLVVVFMPRGVIGTLSDILATRAKRSA
jgi:branched-chain amino acid transport system permease protein